MQSSIKPRGNYIHNLLTLGKTKHLSKSVKTFVFNFSKLLGIILSKILQSTPSIIIVVKGIYTNIININIILNKILKVIAKFFISTVE